MPAAATHRSVPRAELNASPTPRPKKNTTTASTNSSTCAPILAIVPTMLQPLYQCPRGHRLRLSQSDDWAREVVKDRLAFTATIGRVRRLGVCRGRSSSVPVYAGAWGRRVVPGTMPVPPGRSPAGSRAEGPAPHRGLQSHVGRPALGARQRPLEALTALPGDSAMSPAHRDSYPAMRTTSPPGGLDSRPSSWPRRVRRRAPGPAELRREASAVWPHLPTPHQ